MKYLSFLLLALAPTFCLQAADPKPTMAEKTSTMEKKGGYFDFYWDEAEGKVWLVIDKWNEEFLYVNSLSAGVGSNNIGLDRGQLGDSRVVAFKRVGPKVLLVQPNYAFRAESDSEMERRSVEEAFASSVLWGFKVDSSDGDTVLVDATDFFLRDAHGVTGRLDGRKQGSYKLDTSRSAIFLPRTKGFPENSEFEAILTFGGTPKGDYIKEVSPSPDSVTVRQHHSFVKLPDDTYQRRAFDARAGYSNSIEFQDYASGISEPLVKRFIRRHRLVKKNPEAAISEAVEPIIYYLDPGVPEPIRSALMEGAAWWDQAFEAIGFRDAFQVKVLPDDADPMDVRYNLIQWVHRSTRGWSYGATVTDPRTGEIIKGHVTLGSLRVRQDYLIAQGLLSPFAGGEGETTPMLELALARLRQLAAHEVGHTLGIAHNFASSINDRASVMDYPHPLVKLDDAGNIDLSTAYATGIGDWDKVAIAYGYSDFGDEGDVPAKLDKILTDGIEKGLPFISDQDARPAGGAHPDAHLWDNGDDAADELVRVLAVRENALSRFSENSIPVGTPFSDLADVLVPLYLSHRYQVEAASKMIGGQFYTYAVRGDGQVITRIVAGDLQRKALEAVLKSLSPDTLTLPSSILALLPPPAYGRVRGRESFETRTGVTFDPLGAAETAAELSMKFLLHPERAARLVDFHARDEANPGLAEVLQTTLAATWERTSRSDGLAAEVERVVDVAVLDGLLRLASSKGAPTQVKAVAFSKLAELQAWLTSNKRGKLDDAQQSHFSYASKRIERFFEDPAEVEMPESLSPPAGSPIGMGLSCGL